MEPKNTSVGHLWHSHACPSHLLVPVLLQYPHQRAASSSCKHAADVIGRYALTRHLKQQQQGFLPESAVGTRTNGTAIADHVRSHLDRSSQHVFGGLALTQPDQIRHHCIRGESSEE